MTQIVVQETLSTADVCRIYGVKRISVYRWLEAARAGLSRFPLTISEPGQRLRWSKEAILTHLNGEQTPEPVAQSPAKLSKALTKQLADAMADLAELDVRVGN